MNVLKKLIARLQNEDGHAYAWGGGGLFTIFLIVLILIVLF